MADFCKYDSAVRENLPEGIRSRLDELDQDVLDNLLLITGMENAMIGVTENSSGNTVGVYERSLCIREWALGLMESNPGKTEEEAYEEAEEWFSYNTERALPYEKDRAPIIIRGFMLDALGWKHLVRMRPR